MPSMNTKLTPFALTPLDRKVLSAAAKRLKVSRAAVVRKLIHEHAATLESAEMLPNDPARKLGRRRQGKAKGGAA